MSDQFEQQLIKVCERFSRKIAEARSLGCVEACFAEFMGSAVIQQCRELPWDSKESKERLRSLRTLFRKSVDGFYEMAHTGRHCLEKPFGYPGDFAVLEQIYDCAPARATMTAAGKIVDVWGLSQELPRAVAARKDILRSILEDFVRHWEGPEAATVLSIASGGARELREMLPDLLYKIDVSLLDMDSRALGFVEHCFSAYAKKPKIAYYQADALNGGQALETLKKMRPFDLIYSFGLFDYLEDKLLLDCAHSFLPLLKPGGLMVFCLKNREHYDAFVYNWFYDWKFVPRTTDDGYRLAQTMGLRVEQTYVVEGRAIDVFLCRK